MSLPVMHSSDFSVRTSHVHYN